MGSGILCAVVGKETLSVLREQSLSILVREAPSRLICTTHSCRVSSSTFREHEFLKSSRLCISMLANILMYVSHLAPENNDRVPNQSGQLK